MLGTHRKDHAASGVLVVFDPDAVQTARLGGELDARRLVGQEPRPEALGLVAELLHHVGPGHPFGIAREVLDVRGLLEQPAPCEALDHERCELGARRVERRRVTGRPAPDDDHVLRAGRFH